MQNPGGSEVVVARLSVDIVTLARQVEPAVLLHTVALLGVCPFVDVGIYAVEQEHIGELFLVEHEVGAVVAVLVEESLSAGERDVATILVFLHHVVDYGALHVELRQRIVVELHSQHVLGAYGSQLHIACRMTVDIVGYGFPGCGGSLARAAINIDSRNVHAVEQRISVV